MVQEGHSILCLLQMLINPRKVEDDLHDLVILDTAPHIQILGDLFEHEDQLRYRFLVPFLFVFVELSIGCPIDVGFGIADIQLL